MTLWERVTQSDAGLTDARGPVSRALRQPATATALHGTASGGAQRRSALHVRAARRSTPSRPSSRPTMTWDRLKTS